MKWILDNTPYNGPDAHFILNRQVEIDQSNVDLKGFGMERFPTSFQLTVKDILGNLGMEPTSKQLEEVYAIGMRAFDDTRYAKSGLLPGAERVLDYLTEEGDDLLLLTKGDPKIQKRKIKATGLRRWFPYSNINVVLHKDAQVVRDLVGERDKSRVYHVGNSIRSDIGPALEVGIKAVYLPCETWAYERQHNGLSDLPNQENLIKLANLDDIIGVHLSL